MLCDYNWKVLLLVVIATTNAEQTKALSLVYKPSANIPMFIPKYRRKSRVLFLDENEKNQPYGRGEIDLTGDKSRIKFDDSLDYEFTSTDDKNIDNPSGNERYYESSRYRYSYPKYLPYNNNRFGRPYAPNYGFEPYHVPYPPTLRNYGALGGWKARSPRVVFPYAPESANLVTNSHAGPLNDNVVFRDQNFGINDITTDDQNLQDIGSSTDAFAERDANDTRHDRLSRLHYGLKGKSLTKPMFVQITGTKVPYTKRNDIYLPMLKSILPEFKPISDDQINKINLFFKSTKNPKFRKGKAIDNGSPLQELQTHYADKLKTLQGINQPLSLSNLPLQDHNIPLSLSNLPLQDHNPPLSLSNLPLPEHNPPLLLINAPILSQDVKDTIQDLKTSLPETEDRQDDKKCSQGGTCEFFIYCWMVGGLLDGSCGSLLKGCCHRVAKSGVLGVQDSNSIEFANEAVNYGPVINDGSCGIAVSKQVAQRRIVGGDDAGFGTFPWQAYIRIGSSRCNMLMSIFELIGWKQCWIERCGGSLISRRHVVTAGHCVARAQPRHVRVTLGDYVINSAAEPLPAYTFGVRTIKVHPLFKFTPQADRFDVAVLTLDRNVHYMPHIAPICLPERGSDFLGQYGWAAGWGALNPGSRLRPRTLQAVDVPVLDNRVCERWHRANGINVVIYPEMLCAGYRGGGKDSCQGDSGGPLMLERSGRWYLIGVVSAGYSCASRGQPGIYHRVAHTVDWISHATTQS